MLPPTQLSAHTTNVTEGEILSADEAVLIGDRLYTDIACGLNAGISAMLVLSGEATMDDVESGETKPDYIFDDIKSFLEFLCLSEFCW